MKKGLIVGLSILGGIGVISALAIPLAIDTNNKQNRNEANAKIITGIQLTTDGRDFFDGLETKTEAAIQTAVDLGANRPNWLNWFEVTNKNEMVADNVIHQITAITISKGEAVEGVAEINANVAWTYSQELEEQGYSKEESSNEAVLFNEISVTTMTNAEIETEVKKIFPTAANLEGLNEAIGQLTPEQLVELKNVIVTSENKTNVNTVKIEALAGDAAGQYDIVLTFVPESSFLVSNAIITLENVAIPTA